MRIFILVISLMLLGISLSCSNTNDVDGGLPSYSANVFVRYLSQEKQIKTELTLRILDSVEVVHNSPTLLNVHFNNFPLSEKRSNNKLSRWIFEKELNWPSTIQFDLFFAKAKEKEIFEFKTISKPHVPDNKYTPGEPFSISWDGPPIGKNDEFVLFVTDSKQRASFVTLSNPTTISGAEISPDKLNDLSPGEASLYLVKKTTILSENERKKTLCTIEYYTEAVEFLVEG